MTTADAACKPHERVMFNLAIFHFLLPAVLFGTQQLWLIVGLPMLASLLSIVSIYLQSRQSQHQSALVTAHWKLAWRRSKLLIYSYGFSLTLFGLSYLLLLLQSDPNMRMIQLAVVGWFSLLPISMVIVFLLIVEGSALVQARQGLFPKQMKL